MTVLWKQMADYWAEMKDCLKYLAWKMVCHWAETMAEMTEPLK